jgi:2-oxoglutarate dehydrogenase E2 component (dihydrolipoamide succinyltransferase)
MAEIRVPTLGESVAEATVARWLKKTGEEVKADEPLVELETEKAAVEVNAPASGVLSEVAAREGETIAPGALLGHIREGEQAPRKAAAAAPAPTETKRPPAPAAAKIARERGLDLSGVVGSGRGGQVLKEDVLAFIAKARPEAPVEKAEVKPVPPPPSPAPPAPPAPSAPPSPPARLREEGREERVKMTRLRQTIARRLKEAQNTAAMLTTFNEVDMSAVMSLRGQYKEPFEKKHGVKLGLMGFFVKACCQALQEIPAVNAEIDGEEIVYKRYCHIGVAVATERGLVVPVLRDAHLLGLAEIERAIAGFGKRARDGKLDIGELSGGTFTITNGGVFGSLLSTPILNPPQSGILGMHKVEERPVAVAGKVEIRPMMYLALSYDHRLVDGKEAVTFLVRVKETLEDPARLVLEL